MNKIIILGGKDTSRNLKEKIYSYDYVCRVNMNTKWKNKDESKKKDILFLNCHIYRNFLGRANSGPLSLKNIRDYYPLVDKKTIGELYNGIKDKDFFQCIHNPHLTIKTSNEILKDIAPECPYKFNGVPRCGMGSILYFLNKPHHLSYDITISGFSRSEKFDGTYYSKAKTGFNMGYHHVESEVKILNWLIKNYKIKILETKVAIIPARGGSTRLKDKNIRLLGGKPLIQWMVEAVLDSGEFDDVYVSTDSDKIFDAVKHLNVKRHVQPAQNATVKATALNSMIDVMNDIPKYDVFAYFLPTCPFLESKYIKDGVSKLSDTVDYLVSVSYYEEPVQLACIKKDDDIIPVFDNLTAGCDECKIERW